MILETDRLVVRKFCYDDWYDLYEYLSQETVVKYEPYNVFSKEECKEEEFFINQKSNSLLVQIVVIKNC